MPVVGSNIDVYRVLWKSLAYHAVMRQAINDEQGQGRSSSPPRIIMRAMLRDGTEFASA